MIELVEVAMAGSGSMGLVYWDAIADILSGLLVKCRGWGFAFTSEVLLSFVF